jgi:hypothetical protein
MKIKRSLACLIAIVAMTPVPGYASRYSDAVLADNPVAYYRLGETSTATGAVNSSTNGAALNGVYTGFDTTPVPPLTPSTINELGPRPGDVTGSATIRGLESDNLSIRSGGNTTQQVDVPDNALLDITGALTLEAWVYRDPDVRGGNNEGIVGKFVGNIGGTAQDNRSYVLYYNPRLTGTGAKAIGFVLNTTGASTGNVDFNTGIDLPLGTDAGWVHLAAVYEPNVRMSVYMNGVSIGEKTTGLPAADIFNSSAPLWIGRQFRNDTSNTSFEGKIDEVAIYNTALSPAAILAHYHAATRIPGDFDSDGDVDGADFVAWQTNFPKPGGALLSEGDADGDGDVDGADFVVWQTNFPFTPSPGVSPIPEPTSLVLGAIGVTGLWLRWRRIK